jgi:hypothetical protein
MEKFKENRRRREEFAKLVADKHNAHRAKRYYSESIANNLVAVFAISTFTKGTSFALIASILCCLHIFWILSNLFYFNRCRLSTPVPDELKTLMPR